MAERFVGAHVVVGTPEGVEAPLLRGEVTPAGGRAVAPSGLLHALVPAILLGLAGSISSGRMPSRTHQTDSVESRPSALEANGCPLSVRIRSGSP